MFRNCITALAVLVALIVGTAITEAADTWAYSNQGSRQKWDYYVRSVKGTPQQNANPKKDRSKNMRVEVVEVTTSLKTGKVLSEDIQYFEYWYFRGEPLYCAINDDFDTIITVFDHKREADIFDVAAQTIGLPYRAHRKN